MALSGRHVITAVAGEQVRAFVPFPLPPDPAVELGRLLPALDRANQAHLSVSFPTASAAIKAAAGDRDRAGDVGTGARAGVCV